MAESFEAAAQRVKHIGFHVPQSLRRIEVTANNPWVLDSPDEIARRELTVGHIYHRRLPTLGLTVQGQEVPVRVAGPFTNNRGLFSQKLGLKVTLEGVTWTRGDPSLLLLDLLDQCLELFGAFNNDPNILHNSVEKEYLKGLGLREISLGDPVIRNRFRGFVDRNGRLPIVPNPAITDVIGNERRRLIEISG